jgi:hypothetical protein
VAAVVAGYATSSAPPGAHRPLASLGWTAKPEVAGAERTG